MSHPSLQQELQTALDEAAAEAGCELLIARFRGNTLQLILDHADGVTHEHCTAVSRQASAVLDAFDYGPDRYVLEVSSPGLDRELFSARDYERFCGHRIRIKFLQSDGRKRTVRGRLERFEKAGAGTAHVLPDEKSESLEIPLPQVESANLEIELD